MLIPGKKNIVLLHLNQHFYTWPPSFLPSFSTSPIRGALSRKEKLHRQTLDKKKFSSSQIRQKVNKKGP